MPTSDSTEASVMAVVDEKDLKRLLELGEIGRRDAFGISAADRPGRQPKTGPKIGWRGHGSQSRAATAVFGGLHASKGCSITQIQDVDNKFARTCEMGKS